MTDAEAKQILVGMGATVSEYAVYMCSSKYACVDADSVDAVLDGSFTADQLEAIVMWMRNPEGVYK